jgi:uncharacterized protein (TIGR03000 family)
MLRYSMWAAVVALAAWVAAPITAQAGGGGHGGGGHGGGGHAGGVHGGGIHGGSFHGGSFHGDHFHNGVFFGVGLGYGYPYYGGFGYGYPYSGDSYYSSPTTVYYSNNTYVVPGANQSNYYAPEQAPMPMQKAPVADNRARIRVLVQADAALWIDGEPTKQNGANREFVTPVLDPDATYTYTMKARWAQGTEPVEKTIKVDVRANQTSVADFTR